MIEFATLAGRPVNRREILKRHRFPIGQEHKGVLPPSGHSARPVLLSRTAQRGKLPGVRNPTGRPAGACRKKGAQAMMKKLAAATMGLSLMALAAQQVAAQANNCGPRQAILQRLSEKFGETRQSIGMSGENSVVEVFASSETGTWTITVTTANGVTCLVASGQAFETLAEMRPAPGQDA